MQVGDRVRVVDHDNMDLPLIYPGVGTVEDIQTDDNISDAALMFARILMPTITREDLATVVKVRMDITPRSHVPGFKDGSWPFILMELEVVEDSTNDVGGEG
jgi:hypothetical protein